MKKLLCCLLIIFVGLNVSFSQNINSKTPQIGETFASFMKLSQQQLYDTAVYYHKNNILDTALVCFNLIINASESSNSIQNKLTISSLSMAGLIYLNYCDFRNAYKYMTDALILSEKYNFESHLQILYNNMGTIYSHFEEYDIAKTYYLKALDFSVDSTNYFGVLTNIANVEIERENGNMESAFIYLDKALNFSKKTNSKYLPMTLFDMALFYKKTNQIDSAIYYCQFSVNEAKKKNDTRCLIESYHEIGNIFFEKNQLDSAVFYLNLSNSIAAVEKQSITVMPENYLILSKIEESKGNIRKAFDYYKKNSSLKDSIYNTNILGDINQIQRHYEVSKTNRQIDELIFEQQIKKRTIKYQNIIYGILVLLFIVSFIAIYLKKKLIKISKNNINEDAQKELLNKILFVMEDKQIFCNPEFNIYKLVELVDSNQKYVSYVINHSLNKNFREFVNSYRIKEAQRIFSQPNAEKYSIEQVSNKTGFLSRTSFDLAFKNITGVSPSYYVKTLKNSKQNHEKP